jgi:thiol-disulfide isomerase/thioredoxin
MLRLVCALCLAAAAIHAQPGCAVSADKQRLDAAAKSPRVGTLAAEFAQKLAAAPDDPTLLYLSARSLMGKDTKSAIAQLDRAAVLAPNLPWTYDARAEIYASPKFRDDARARDNMRAFRRLCPDALDIYRFLDKILDPAEAADWAATLRRLLESRQNSADVRYWTPLWAAEFRALPNSEFPRERERIAADVRRLAAISSSDRTFLGVLRDGYQLSGQTEAADRILHRLDPDSESRKAYDAWIEKWPVRTRALTPEEQAAFSAEYAKAAADWVKRWPDSPSAWQFRAMTLASLPDSSPADLEHAGLEILRLDADLQGRPWNSVPHQLRVAQYWLRKGIRPAECLRLAEEALAQIRLGPEDPNDMTGSRGDYGFPYDSQLWEAMVAVVDAAVQVKDYPKANTIVADMQQWLDDNRAKESDRTTGYERFRSRYFHSAGAIQEAQGHKLDAVSLYLSALANGFRFPGEQQHARQLWNELGGSREAWTILTRRPPPLPAKPAPVAEPIATATAYAAWTPFNRALPNPDLRDTTGKTWTLADFQGKTTLINVFATWCGPCRDEFPHLQELYEKMKDRRDLQLIAISVDENPGEIEPFLTARHITFPVLALGRPYIESIIGHLSIPRNWIVGPDGAVREQSIGFDDKIKDWPASVLKRLEAK